MIFSLKKIIIFGLLLGSFFTTSLVLVNAQGSAGSGFTPPAGSGFTPPAGTGVTPEKFELKSPFAFKTIPEFLNKILDIIIKIGGILAFFFIIYSGFLFVTAAGSEDQVKKAKAVFLWTVVGVAIVLGAKVIAELLVGTVNSVVK